MEDFRVVLVEGVFSRTGGFFYVQEPGQQPTRLDQILRPLEGQRSRLALHHLPPTLDETKWGGGSCLWEPHPCPAGHHWRPNFLLNVSGEGILGREDQKWFLDQFDGSRLFLPFELLAGHHGRVAGATLFDVEAMRDSLSSSGIDIEQVEGMGERISDLRELLEKVKKG